MLNRTLGDDLLPPLLVTFGLSVIVQNGLLTVFTADSVKLQAGAIEVATIRLAEGVYVGASQGLTPQSSKVVVEIEVRPRVTVQGDFSQTGGSGLGLNYKYDY